MQDFPTARNQTPQSASLFALQRLQNSWLINTWTQEIRPGLAGLLGAPIQLSLALLNPAFTRLGNDVALKLRHRTDDSENGTQEKSAHKLTFFVRRLRVIEFASKR